MCHGDPLYPIQDITRKTFQPSLSFTLNLWHKMLNLILKTLMIYDFLRKIASLPPLPDDIILCTIDVAGLYPNIPLDEGLIALRKSLESRKDKKISTGFLTDLAECVLKNNYD